MEVKGKPCGDYGTNCYIVTVDGKDIIIDCGQNATEWVSQNVTNPVAIISTHGHFDHIWSNKELKEKYNIPLYIEKKDAFLLQNDIFGRGTPKCEADYEIDGDQEVEISGIKVKFILFGGHTPGCSVVEIGDNWFSGDFIFKNSIGRTDFPYSDPSEMKKSINKFLKIDYDKIVYTGHGEPTTIKQEQQTIGGWLNYL
jgi:glyoxylase-like metal-dependent hydrolase (beta-lactamase superfamily II)